MTAPALLLLAHGSRDPDWARPVTAIAERIRAGTNAPPVAVAFLEFAAPDFATATEQLVRDGASAIRIAPVFLGQGGHLRRDVDALLNEARSRWPEVAFSVSPPMGNDAHVLDAIATWAATGDA